MQTGEDRQQSRTVGRRATHDRLTVEGFGYEWSRFDQSTEGLADARRNFDLYFHAFPWSDLPSNAKGVDIGCGSGRWARFVAERAGFVLCLDPSLEALRVATRNLSADKNTATLCGAAGSLPVAPNSFDFAYCLGVLHHTPDARASLADVATVLRPGAPLLVYLYYAFDNRPRWFRLVWQASDAVRRVICRLPDRSKALICDIIAALVYWPLARLAFFAERAGRAVQNLPLSAYRNAAFYTMRTDSLDRFGTRLEQRFTAAQVREMMVAAGLQRVVVSPDPPYWCAVGYKAEKERAEMSDRHPPAPPATGAAPHPAENT